MLERWQLALPLGKCSCCQRAFTCYPPEFYPRRQYQLDVVADVVAGVALGSEPVADIAAAVTASSTSARRWTAWVAVLTRAGELVAAAARVDASVATVALPPPRAARHPRAAAVLAGLEALGTALTTVLDATAFHVITTSGATPSLPRSSSPLTPLTLLWRHSSPRGGA